MTAKKLDIVTLGAAAVLVGLFVWDRFAGGERSATPVADSAHEPAGEVAQADTPVLVSLGEQSIAVLPFANRSNRDDDLFFTDGIHDDLLTQLAKIKDLDVISRTSVMQYRDTDKRVSEIARELGVATILEGGVQRAGQRIRINAQLIDANDKHIWAETFDREMTIDNLFDIQSEITKHIVAAVKGELSPEDQAQLTGAPTQNLQAYEAYLKGRDILRAASNDISLYPEAEPYAQRAIALDPNFGQALLQAAKINGYIAWFFADQGADRRRQAAAAIDRAGELLGTDAPEWLAARGVYLYRFEQDFAGALNSLMEAHAAIPGDADILDDLALTQRRLGLWEESVASSLEAARLDPGGAGTLLVALGSLQRMRDWSRFEGLLEQGRRRFPRHQEIAALHAWAPLSVHGDVAEARRRFERVAPHMSGAYYAVAILLPLVERDYEAAVEMVEQPELVRYVNAFGIPQILQVPKAFALNKLDQTEQSEALLREIAAAEPDAEVRGFVRAIGLNQSSLALALLGEHDKAIAMAEESLRIYGPDDDKMEGTVQLSNLALVLGMAGQRDRSLQLLEELLETPSPIDRWTLYLDPRWDFFRDDERFNALIRPPNLDQASTASR